MEKKTITLPINLFEAMYLSLERSSAVYELLHAHARGETDLTEDQLANVVMGVNQETRVVMIKAAERRPTMRVDAGWRPGLGPA